MTVQARPPMDVLLFDLDGVLLSSEGYYESLRQTVSHLGRALGFAHVYLSQEDIDLFESLDITAEWDSSALCVALLLDRAWPVDPELGLPDAPPLPSPPSHSAEAPDFGAFVRSLADGGGPIVKPLAQARERLSTGTPPRTPAQLDLLGRVLDRARDPDRSITYQMIQEFNLGSRTYSEVYHRRPWVETESLLATRDQASLGPGELDHLRRWPGPGRAMAIVTNRPSLSPAKSIHTPEAEIGVAAAGMDGIPFMAAGSLAWAAERAGLPPGSFLKPSPVHMLAGMQLGLMVDIDEAIRAAVALADGHSAEARWAQLQGARVTVFEDAPKGMRSARAAAELLHRAGIETDLRLYGITTSSTKATALAAEGARVFPNLSPALREVLHGNE